MAIKNNKEDEVIKHLNKISVNERDENHRTPLHIAVSEGRRAIAKLLIEEGAVIDAVDTNNWTPLHHACSTQNLALIELLLYNDCNVKAVTSDFATCLHYLVRKRPAKEKLELYTEIMKEIIFKGANINVRNKVNGETSLHQACSRGNEEAIKIMLDCKSDVNILNNIGETALHYAVTSGNSCIVNMLLAYGASVDIKSAAGETPINLAVKLEDNSIIDIFKISSPNT